jgi:hypothetical protein
MNTFMTDVVERKVGQNLKLSLDYAERMQN